MRDGPPERARTGLRLRAVVVVAAMTIGIAACGPPVTGTGSCGAPAGPADPVSQRVFELVNQERRAAQVRELVWNQQLWCLASEWSTQLGQSGQFHHRDLDAVLRSAEFSRYRTIGENLLRGPSSMSGDEVHTEWMGSETHRANVLSSAYTSFAIAIFSAPDGTLTATENFAG